jgi:hypothetical protein
MVYFRSHVKSDVLHMKCFTIRAYPHRPLSRDGWDIAERNNAECKGGSSPCSFELYVAFIIMRATIPPSNSIEQYRRRFEPLQLRTGVHSLAIVSTQVYILKTCRFEHYMLRLCTPGWESIASVPIKALLSRLGADTLCLHISIGIY